MTPVASITGLTHGIELRGGGLYASTPTTVYRWEYRTGQTALAPSQAARKVIVGMDRYASGELGAPDGHTTRTLAFDPDGKWLYVSIGSEGNVDMDSHRAHIRRFDGALVTKIMPSWPAKNMTSFDGGVRAPPRL